MDSPNQSHPIAYVTTFEVASQYAFRMLSFELCNNE
jgi:hypothetical protein